jgi:hypothetical protein
MSSARIHNDKEIAKLDGEGCFSLRAYIEITDSNRFLLFYNQETGAVILTYYSDITGTTEIWDGSVDKNGVLRV